jgi:hypothetical protein
MGTGAKSAMLICEEKAKKEHTKKASEHSIILKMRLKLEQKLDQKTKEVEFLNTQNDYLKEQDAKTKVERNLNKLKALHSALTNDKMAECKLKSVLEEKCLQLKAELAKVPGIKGKHKKVSINTV